MTRLSRRRFLSIAAASASLPVGARAARSSTWRGSALGAPASMQFAGLSQHDAAPLIVAVEDELMRLEKIFSLYRPDSEISRLNANGHLAHPSPELLQVLGFCDLLHTASGGAFDPTIQPYWMALAGGETGAALTDARARVGFDKLRFDSSEIRFAGPNPGALTLNGVAQGAITDRIAALIRDFGMRDVLIDMGEIAALGVGLDKTPWRAGVADPHGRILQRVFLRDRALATSAPAAMMLDASGGHGHILQPRGEGVVRQLASVSASSAMVADGLSTALCLLPGEATPAVLEQFPGARLEAMA